MKKAILAVTFFLIAIIQVIAVYGIKETTLNAYGKSVNELPLTFRKNMGQWDEKIIFAASNKNGGVCFLKNELSFSHTRPVQNPEEETEEREMMVWNLHFEGANPEPNVLAYGAQKSFTNYLRGKDPLKFVLNVPDYKLLNYKELYKGIDLHYYTKEQDLKYDYIIYPQGNINDIKMRCEGINGLDINRKGELEISTSWGTLIEEAPYSYQLIDGIQKEVDVRYRLINNTTYGFEVLSNYDPTKELIIDPVILEWATFGGGIDLPGSPGDGYGLDLQVDDNGDVYACGYYSAGYFTTPGVYDDSFAKGLFDAIIFKLDKTGSKMHFATFLGGNGFDRADGIVLGPDGKSIYMVGSTQLTRESGPPVTLPVTTNAFDKDYNGGPGYLGGPEYSRRGDDLFVAKLSIDGKNLEYCTFLGGSKMDDPARGGIEVNSAGEAFVTGVTESDDFPTTTGAFQPKHAGGLTDAFVTKLSTDGSSLLYSTFLGGSGDDNGVQQVSNYSTSGGIALNSNEEVYVTGWTNSTDFPTKNALQATNRGAFDVYVTRLNAQGSGLIFSTYLGSTSNDEGIDLTLDKNNDIYVVGGSASTNFPTSAGAFDRFHNPVINDGRIYKGIIFKLSGNGQNLLYSTYIGTNTGTNGAITFVTGIQANSSGEAYVVGHAQPKWQTLQYIPKSPTSDCAIETQGEGNFELFVAKMNANASDVLYSTLLTGTNREYHGKISLREREPCFEEVTLIHGCHSYEDTYPITPGSYQPVRLATASVIADIPTLARLSASADVDFDITTPSCGTPIQFTDKTQPSSCMWKSGTWTPTSWLWDFGDGTTSTKQNPSHIYNMAGEYRVSLIVGCPSDSIVKTIKINGGTFSGTPATNSQASDCGQNNGTATVSVSGTGPYTYRWNDAKNQTTATAIGLAPGTYKVTVSDAGSCASKTVSVVVGSIPEEIEVTSESTPATCGQNDGTASVTATGGSGTYTYQWDDPSAQQTSKATGLAAGNYLVKVKDEQGCPAETTLVVTVKSQGDLQVDATGTTVKCGTKGNATITVSGGDGKYSYQWDAAAGNQTTATATGLDPGVYNYSVEDESGCKGSGQVVLEGESGVAVTTEVSYADNCDRFGGENGTAVAVPVGGTKPYTYQWDDVNQQITDSAKGLPAGVYQVVISDANGCTATSKATIEEQIQLTSTVDIQPSCDTCSDGKVTVSIGGFATPPYTIRWNDENQQTTATASGLKPGTYAVIVTDDKDCRNTDTVTIGNPTGIESIRLLEKQISIYPNPNNGRFIVKSEISANSPIHLNIFDLTGRNIYQRKLYAGTNVISTDQLTKGIYLVEFTIGYSRLTKRIQVME